MPAKESNVDVLIVGAGPAGHMAATWFARTGVNARIIDKRSAVQFVGQADGLQSRTLEVFQSFGFGDRAEKESNHMLEMAFWDPGPDGGIKRSTRMPDTAVGISRFQQTVIHQGRVEAWFQEHIKKYSNDSLQLERPVQGTDLKIDESIPASDIKSYPVAVTVQHLEEKQGLVEQYGGKVANGLFRAFDGDGNKELQGETEIIHAKYVIGCDGAHSWVRKSLGFAMEGESTDYVWGVLDAIPVTDFPDIRSRCAIHSANDGSIMIIPREHGMVRLYIQLKEAPRDPAGQTEAELKAGNTSSGRIDRSKITPELILESARKIFAPYSLDMVDVQWYTAYQIGQRVSTGFQKNNRVFIAGDACHTHSPKAGQGMNVSMMDTYNLAWKIALVVKGLSSPEILSTYEQERKRVAKNLIAYDYKLSRLFSGKPSEDGTGISLEEFQNYFEKGLGFASGTIVDYDQSLIVDKPAAETDESEIEAPIFTSPLATKCPIGRRLDTAQVIIQSDSKPIQLVDYMPSDGRWRIAYFAGEIADPSTATAKFLKTFGAYLDSPKSFIKKYTPATARIDSVVDVLLIHASPRYSVEWNDFPSAFKPRDHKKRMDYFKIFTDDASFHRGHGHAYAKYGIDPKKGAILVIRPDGHVASVQPLTEEGINSIETFFAGFSKEQSPSWESNGGYLDTNKKEQHWYGVGEVGEPVLAV